MADNNGYEYMNEESINELLKCSVCFKPFVDPASTRCRTKPHTFCRHCIEKRSSDNPSCPTCHEELHIEELTPVTDSIIIGMLNKMLVKCLRCDQMGLERGTFKEHITNTCPKVNMFCPSSDIKCPWTGLRDELDNHLSICIFNSLRPLIIQLQYDNQQLKDQVNQQQTQIEMLQNKDQELNDLGNQQRTPVEEFQNENQQLNVRLNQQQTQIEVLQNDNQQLNNQQTQIKEFQSENQQLIARINQQQNQIEELHNENQQLNACVKRQETQMVVLQADSQLLYAQLDQQQTQIEVLQMTINN
jgi:hypothetical protein